MKKVFSILFIVFLLLSAFSLTVYADEDDNSPWIDQPEMPYNQDILDQLMKNNEDSLKKSDFEYDGSSNEAIDKAAEELSMTGSTLMGLFEDVLLGKGNLYGYLNVDTISNMLFTVFYPIGIAIFAIMWCVGLSKSASELDLFEGKVIIRELVKLFTGLLLIVICPSILKLIVLASNQITVNILQNSTISVNDIAAATGGKIGSLESFQDHTPIIGYFITLINFITAQSKIFGIYVVFTIVTGIMTIVMAIRQIKLAIFTGVAPAFVACIGNDDTKRYSQNFMARFILLAGQIVIISAIYGAFKIAMAGFISAGMFSESTLGAYLTGAFVMIALCVAMLKSEKWFSSMFV